MYFRFFILRSRDKRSDHSRRRFNQSFHRVNIVYHTFSRLSPPKLLNYYVLIGFTQQAYKLEFVRERDIDSLRRGRVSRPFAQRPIYRFAQPFWEIFPLAAGGETPPLRPYKLEFVGQMGKGKGENNFP